MPLSLPLSPSFASPPSLPPSLPPSFPSSLLPSLSPSRPQHGSIETDQGVCLEGDKGTALYSDVHELQRAGKMNVNKVGSRGREPEREGVERCPLCILCTLHSALRLSRLHMYIHEYILCIFTRTPIPTPSLPPSLTPSLSPSHPPPRGNHLWGQLSPNLLLSPAEL